MRGECKRVQESLSSERERERERERDREREREDYLMRGECKRVQESLSSERERERERERDRERERERWTWTQHDAVQELHKWFERRPKFRQPSCSTEKQINSD